jgi:antitoxin component YwqK of YwqJK toxin-antitoxin module
MYKAFFRDDKPVGEMKRYFESGRLKAIMNYNRAGESAFARLYYENGNPAAEGRYFKTLKDSVWTYYSYYSKTITARETWNKGVRTGMMLIYYENGDISEKLEWRNNKKSGIWEQYFKGNILKMKAQYTDNKLEGEFVVYTITGTPSITGTYRNNLRDGKWTFYDENGNVEQVLNYQSGTAAETEKLNAEQQEFFRNIDDAQGKYSEPDETDFLPQR